MKAADKQQENVVRILEHQLYIFILEIIYIRIYYILVYDKKSSSPNISNVIIET